MTDKLDLDAIDKRQSRARELHDTWARTGRGENTRDLALFRSWQDIPALTAALREAWARVERLESENFDLEELLGVSEGQVNDLKHERAQHHEEQTQ